jgi:hypothetical protein
VLQEFLEKPTIAAIDPFLTHPVATAATDNDTAQRRSSSTKGGGWKMSPLTIFGLVWLGFGLLTIAIAVWKKLNVVPWILVGPVLGLYGIVLVLVQAGAKARAGSWSADGSTYYGAGYGGGGFGFDHGHHGGVGGFDGGHGGHGGFCGFDGGHGGHGGFC